MGAKFKAPLDSRCLAEMEEQHFRLPLPPRVCLSFALLSFNISFPASASFIRFTASFLLFSSPFYFWSKPLTVSASLFFIFPIIAFSIFNMEEHSALQKC